MRRLPLLVFLGCAPDDPLAAAARDCQREFPPTGGDDWQVGGAELVSTDFATLCPDGDHACDADHVMTRAAALCIAEALGDPSLPGVPIEANLVWLDPPEPYLGVSHPVLVWAIDITTYDDPENCSRGGDSLIFDAEDAWPHADDLSWDEIC
jgi:hypothetical protein